MKFCMKQVEPSNRKGRSGWPQVIKLFSCSTQLSTEFQLLIKTKIPTNEEVSCFSLSVFVFLMLINFKMTKIVGILIYLTPVKTQLLQYNLTQDLMLFYHSNKIKA